MKQEVIPPAPQPCHFAEWNPFDLVADPRRFAPITIAPDPTIHEWKRAHSKQR